MKTIEKKGKLIAFLYRLMRDEIHIGIIEKIVQEIEHCSEAQAYKEEKSRNIFRYTNNYLVNYAEEIIKRLLK